MAGRLLRAVAVQEQQSAVVARGAQHHLAREVVVVRDDRADQAALAAGGERDDVVDRVVGHHGGYRPEGLDLVDHAGLLRLVAQQQQRRQERAGLGIGALDLDLLRIAEHEVGLLAQLGDGLAHLVTLADAGQCAHRHALGRRVADDHLGQACLQRVDHRADLRARHEGTADRGALLAALGGHFLDHFLHVQIELGGAGHRVRTQD